ncbi:hypothetical protein ACFU9B_35435 [Streptomyces sp. NPDC057592]|uniref:hypothetical protein n=1 Tax=unclassified Streptomyces TaxID=2593676 RepID=UPI00368116F7
MTVLGVHGISGQHSVFEVDGIQQQQQQLEGRDLIALGGDLSLGQNHAVVVHRGQQLDHCGGSGSGDAHRPAVHRDGRQRRLLRRLGLL